MKSMLCVWIVCCFSIVYAQQWVSASGKLVLSEFNEETNTASGTFEGTLTQMLDDKGGFVLTSPKPTMKISGKFEKIAFRKVD